MKVSEFISALEKVLDRHGDIHVIPAKKMVVKRDGSEPDLEVVYVFVDDKRRNECTGS